MKLLSEDPANYKDAPREGIRRVLEEVTGKRHPREHPLDTSRIASIRMGTTVSICRDIVVTPDRLTSGYCRSTPTFAKICLSAHQSLTAPCPECVEAFVCMAKS